MGYYSLFIFSHFTYTHITRTRARARAHTHTHTHTHKTHKLAHQKIKNKRNLYKY